MANDAWHEQGVRLAQFTTESIHVVDEPTLTRNGNTRCDFKSSNPHFGRRGWSGNSAGCKRRRLVSLHIVLGQAGQTRLLSLAENVSVTEGYSEGSLQSSFDCRYTRT